MGAAETGSNHVHCRAAKPIRQRITRRCLIDRPWLLS